MMALEPHGRVSKIPGMHGSRKEVRVTPWMRGTHSSGVRLNAKNRDSHDLYR